MPFFRWIRDSVRNAVLGGVQDALEQLNWTASENPPENLDNLAAAMKVAIAVPGPETKRAKK